MSGPQSAPRDARQISARLKIVRIALNLTQRAMAKKLGISSSYMHEVEKGDSKPNADILAGVAVSFPEVNLNWLATGLGDPFASAGASPQLRHSPLHDAAALLGAGLEEGPDPYPLATDVEAKIHSASLVLKGVNWLILDNIGPDSTEEELKALLEVAGQLIEVTATYVKEAYDAAGKVTSVLAGSHQRSEGAHHPRGAEATEIN